jgi:NADH:ubiquinone oxidoreductase subunit E
MEDTEKLVEELVSKYGKTRNSLLPVLQGVVQEEHFLSDDAMIAIAKALNLSSADVYGTASFYSFLDTEPRGDNIIRVCKTITCKMKGKQRIIEAIENHLKIKQGETTRNNKFTLLAANCLGWCHKGPVMLVNDDVYPHVDPDHVIEILDKYL